MSYKTHPSKHIGMWNSGFLFNEILTNLKNFLLFIYYKFLNYSLKKFGVKYFSHLKHTLFFLPYLENECVIY